MPHARAFTPLRGNHMPDPYRSYHDRMAIEDTRYDYYVAYCGTVPWDDDALYSGWLAYRSTIIVRHLPERVMRQFGYCQTIPRHPSISANIGIARRQIDEAFADIEHHMVPDEDMWALVDSGRVAGRRGGGRRGGMRGEGKDVARHTQW
ncbi:uncharacterized protein LOC131637083 [Vicia villosa]|uniref:uncharacterized protein LOC131637083 n=1 Tax=Vicia villosa TaxID=3911 RepID=UPI00273CDE94|nr:uncharacterized protein LOC131637083 [Vicia villosa]